VSNPPELKSSVGKINIWIPVLVAAITALGTYGAAWLQYREPDKPTSSFSTVAPTTTAPELKLEIKGPSGRVDQCAFIEGKGTAPRGSTIWIAEHAVGDQGYYGLTPVEDDPSGGWHAHIDLGPVGNKFDVFAFVLGAEATALLKNLEVDGDGLEYFKNVPGQTVSRTVEKKSGPDTPCS
jgi:hypothetical protein